MSKRIVFPLLIVLVLAGGLWYWRVQSSNPPAGRPAVTVDREQNTKPSSGSDSQNPVADPALPKTLLLKVPFTPQAPTANWDELHNEACEEASSLMAAAYFNG